MGAKARHLRRRLVDPDFARLILRKVLLLTRGEACPSSRTVDASPSISDLIVQQRPTDVVGDDTPRTSARRPSPSRQRASPTAIDRLIDPNAEERRRYLY